MHTELLTVIEHLDSPRISGIRISQSLFFCVVFCRSLFVLIQFAIVLSIFDIRLLITPLASSNFSYPCCFGWCLCCSLYQLYVLSICQLCCRCVFFFNFYLVMSYSINWWLVTTYWYLLTLLKCFLLFSNNTTIICHPLISPWDMVTHLWEITLNSILSSCVWCKDNSIPQWCM